MFLASATLHGLPKPLVHVPRTVCERDGRLPVAKQLAIAGLEALEHRVRGRHGWQGHVDALRLASGHQAVRQHHRGLRLAAAGLVFDDEQGWAVGKIDRLRPPLHRAWTGIRQQRAVIQAGSRWDGQHAGFVQRLHSLLLRPLPVEAQVDGFGLRRIGLDALVREPLLIGAEPIRQDGDSGQSEGCWPHLFLCQSNIGWRVEQGPCVRCELAGRVNAGSAKDRTQRGELRLVEPIR